MTRQAAVLRRLAAALVLVAGLTGGVADAQSQRVITPASSPAPQSELLLAGSEQTLWLAEVRGGQTRLFVRSLPGDFDLGRLIHGRIRALAAGREGELYVGLDRGAVYRYSLNRATPESDLPGDRAALALAHGGGRLYALIEPTPAASLPTQPANTRRTAAPRDNGDAEPAVIIAPQLMEYDGFAWSAAAALPPAVVWQRGRSPLNPQIVGSAEASDPLRVAWVTPAGDAIHTARLDETRQSWRESTPVAVRGLQAYWLMRVGRVPTLVVVESRESNPAPSIRVFRLLDQHAQAWIESNAAFPVLPENSPQLARVRCAAGFNQSVALIAELSDGASHLWFAGFGQLPAEASRSITDIMSVPARQRQLHDLVRLVTLGILAVVMISLLTLRRDAMTQTRNLPAGLAPALASQRAVAAAIDLLIFALTCGILVGVDVRTGLSELAGWGLAGGASNTLPPMRVLGWWAATVLSYSTYCLVMELLIGQTIGKALLRIRVLNEQGARPAFWQILTRNAMRLIELVPHFWILAIMVLISRNRQRVGDLFARTITVRRAPIETQPSD